MLPFIAKERLPQKQGWFLWSSADFSPSLSSFSLLLACLWKEDLEAQQLFHVCFGIGNSRKCVARHLFGSRHKLQIYVFVQHIYLMQMLSLNQEWISGICSVQFLLAVCYTSHHWRWYFVHSTLTLPVESWIKFLIVVLNWCCRVIAVNLSF